MFHNLIYWNKDYTISIHVSNEHMKHKNSRTTALELRKFIPRITSDSLTTSDHRTIINETQPSFEY